MMADKPQTKKIKWPQVIIGLVLILCGFGLMVYKLYLSPSSSQSCATKECFMAAANECQDSTFTAEETYGTVKYDSKGCVFTKTIIRSSKDELPEMRAVFEGKSLTCEYKIGEFDQRWMTSLIYGINYCKGELRESIGNLLLFVEPTGKTG